MDLECKRCGYKWMAKFDKKPKVCSRCKSIYWEKELTNYWKEVRRKNKVNKGEQEL